MNKPLHKSKNKAAFTLLELAVALVGFSLFSTYGTIEGAFTLIEMSLVLLVLAVLGGTILGKLTQDTRQNKSSDLQKRLDKIEFALLSYGKVNARLPCPADGTKKKGIDATFGTEAANPGSCNSVVSQGLFDDTQDTVGGVLPVRTLSAYGLQDSDILDPYGNEFGYFVSKKITSINAFVTYPIYSCVGSIHIYDGSTPSQVNTITSTGNLRTQSAIALVMSYGPNGHGAFQASAVRKYVGSVNGDEWLNCHCNATGPTAFTAPASFTLHPPVVDATNALNTFDDMGRYYRRSSFSSIVKSPPPSVSPPSPPSPPPPPGGASPPPPSASPCAPDYVNHCP